MLYCVEHKKSIELSYSYSYSYGYSYSSVMILQVTPLISTRKVTSDLCVLHVFRYSRIGRL